MFELMETTGQQAVIKVLGIGGGGGNAVDHMLSANSMFLAMHTNFFYC